MFTSYQHLMRSNQYVSSLLKNFGVCCIILTLVACATGPAKEANPTLTEVKSEGFDHVLMLSGTALTPFKKVFIEEPQVSFNKHWLTDYRGDYSQRDLDRISTDYAAMLKKTLAKGFSEDTQVVVVESATEADLILRPLLRNLNIYAPDLSLTPRTKYYVHDVGNATLDLSFVRATDEVVVAQFIDNRETNSNISNRLEPTNRVTNTRHFRRLMERWTTNLTAYLLDAGAVAAK